VKLFDSVRLRHALPDHGLQAGDVGVIMDALNLTEPIYLVEFIDDEGRTRALVYVEPELIEPASGNSSGDTAD